MKAKNAPHELSIIGYWSEPDVRPEQTRGLPDPADLRGEWDDDARRAVLAHLKQGKIFRQFMGSSTCRICGQQVGSKEYTDGVYAWPEGLEHYVESHDVRLMDTLVAHCQSRQRRLPRWLKKLDSQAWLEGGPESATPAMDDDAPPEWVVDETAWLDWSALNTPAKPSADAISLQQAADVCSRLSHPSWQVSVDDVNGRWRLQMHYGDAESRIYLQKCNHSTIERRLLGLRPPDPNRILDPDQVEAIAAEYDGEWGAARVLAGDPSGRAWFVWVRPADQDWPSHEEVDEALKGDQRFGWVTFRPGGARSYVAPAADEEGWRWLLVQEREQARVRKASV